MSFLIRWCLAGDAISNTHTLHLAHLTCCTCVSVPRSVAQISRCASQPRSVAHASQPSSVAPMSRPTCVAQPSRTSQPSFVVAPIPRSVARLSSVAQPSRTSEPSSVAQSSRYVSRPSFVAHTTHTSQPSSVTPMSRFVSRPDSVACFPGAQKTTTTRTGENAAKTTTSKHSKAPPSVRRDIPRALATSPIGGWVAPGCVRERTLGDPFVLEPPGLCKLSVSRPCSVFHETRTSQPSSVAHKLRPVSGPLSLAHVSVDSDEQSGETDYDEAFDDRCDSSENEEESLATELKFRPSFVAPASRPGFGPVSVAHESHKSQPSCVAHSLRSVSRPDLVAHEPRTSQPSSVAHSSRSLSRPDLAAHERTRPSPAMLLFCRKLCLGLTLLLTVHARPSPPCYASVALCQVSKAAFLHCEEM